MSLVSSVSAVSPKVLSNTTSLSIGFKWIRKMWTKELEQTIIEHKEIEHKDKT